MLRVHCRAVSAGHRESHSLTARKADKVHVALLMNPDSNRFVLPASPVFARLSQSAWPFTEFGLNATQMVGDSGGSSYFSRAADPEVQPSRLRRNSADDITFARDKHLSSRSNTLLGVESADGGAGPPFGDMCSPQRGRRRNSTLASNGAHRLTRHASESRLSFATRRSTRAGTGLSLLSELSLLSMQRPGAMSMRSAFSGEEGAADLSALQHQIEEHIRRGSDRKSDNSEEADEEGSQKTRSVSDASQFTRASGTVTTARTANASVDSRWDTMSRRTTMNESTAGLVRQPAMSCVSEATQSSSDTAAQTGQPSENKDGQTCGASQPEARDGEEEEGGHEVEESSAVASRQRTEGSAVSRRTVSTSPASSVASDPEVG